MLPETVVKLIIGVIEPTGYHGVEVWQSIAYNTRKLAPIEKVMRQACLLLAGSFRTTSYPAAYALAGIRPPTQQTIQQALYFDSKRRHKKDGVRFASARLELSVGQC